MDPGQNLLLLLPSWACLRLDQCPRGAELQQKGQAAGVGGGEAGQAQRARSGGVGGHVGGGAWWEAGSMGTDTGGQAQAWVNKRQGSKGQESDPLPCHSISGMVVGGEWGQTQDRFKTHFHQLDSIHGNI